MLRRQALVVLGIGSLLACGTTKTPTTAPAATLVSSSAPPPPVRCDFEGELLAHLNQSLRVTLFASPSVPAGVRDKLAVRLERWKKASTKVDTALVEITGPVQETAARAAGFVGLPDDTHAAFLGLAFQYGSVSGHVTLPPTDTTGTELLVAMALRRAMQGLEGTKDTIGVLGGHGELALTDPNLMPKDYGRPTLQTIFAENYPSIVLKPVELGRSGNGPLAGLLVTQPSTDLSAADLQAIDELVMQGVPVAVLASAVNVRAGDPKSSATIDAHGLARLLEGYGIALHDDVVVDPDRAFEGQANIGMAPHPMHFPQLPKLAPDSSMLPFFRLESVSVPFASSLALEPGRQPGARVHAIGSTSARASVLLGPTVDLNPSRTFPKAQGRTLVVAAIAEGTLQSAFVAGKRSVPGARILVVSSSQMLANPFVLATAGGGATANQELVELSQQYAQDVLTTQILFLDNTIHWMTLPPGLAACATQPL